jgi:hypothetical protein
MTCTPLTCRCGMTHTSPVCCPVCKTFTPQYLALKQRRLPCTNSPA